MEVEILHSRQLDLHSTVTLNGFHRLHFSLRVVCWNVWSLVEADGGIKTAPVKTGQHPVSVDKKVRL